MPKAPKITHYVVTSMLEDGTVNTDAADEAPKKGDSFEYVHTETRVGQVTKVVAVYDDESEVVLSELGDTHHALEEDVDGDELPTSEELVADPPDDDNPPDAE